MITLILAILIGIGISLFSTQNSNTVTITLANYPISGVPLYIIVISSLFLGIVISFIFHTISLLSATMILHQRDAKIKSKNTMIANLQEKINQLEIANTELREKTEAMKQVEPNEKHQHNPLSSLFQPNLYNKI